jgi:hypothetical protein
VSQGPITAQDLTGAMRVFTLSTVSNDPVLIAYAVKRSSKDNKPVWTRIGKAYPHEHGAGLT